MSVSVLYILALEDNFIPWHLEHKIISDLHRLKSLEIVYIQIVRKHTCVHEHASEVNCILYNSNLYNTDIRKYKISIESYEVSYKLKLFFPLISLLLTFRKLYLIKQKSAMFRVSIQHTFTKKHTQPNNKFHIGALFCYSGPKI